MSHTRALALSGMLACLIAAVSLSAPSIVSAFSDGEDYILSFLRVTVMAQFQGITGQFQNQESLVNTRFDTTDAKLDRIYAACGGTTTPTRRVTSAQASSCINNCFTTTANSASEGVIDSPRFVACVSRCPSNTLRNQECAQRYTRSTEGTAMIGGQWTWVSFNQAGFARVCARNREARYAESCRLYAESLVSGLTACLVDQQVYTCQQDCDGNYRNPEGHMLCTLRCNGRARAAELYNGLRESGFINAQDRLGMDTITNTALSPAVIQPQIAPTQETYAQCVYRCDAERTSCLTQAPQSEGCQSEYNTCYTGCSSRLIGGSGAR